MTHPLGRRIQERFRMKPNSPVESNPQSRPSQARIGCGLRALFEGVTDSPLPDRLADLTAKLDAALERGELLARRRSS